MVEGDFVKAITFLFPGYMTTPEYSLLLRSSAPWGSKSDLLDFVCNLDAEKIYTSENLRLVKWFHDNGVPQVIQLGPKIYARFAAQAS